MAPAWLYETNPDNTARYVLATAGENPLACFGVNPSTAEPGNLDPTVRRVQLVAEKAGHDSFMMFNLYPQRATCPKNLHMEADRGLVAENEKWIAKLLGGRAIRIWAAWGGLVDSRPYFAGLLLRLGDMPELGAAEWVRRGPLTKNGHPRHPLYGRNDWEFYPYAPCCKRPRTAAEKRFSFPRLE